MLKQHVHGKTSYHWFVKSNIFVSVLSFWVHETAKWKIFSSDDNKTFTQWLKKKSKASTG